MSSLLSRSILSSVPELSRCLHSHSPRVTNSEKSISPRLQRFSCFSTYSLSRLKSDQLSVSSIISIARREGDGWHPDGKTVAWLCERNYTPQHVVNWREALVSPTAELALRHVTVLSPVYMILQTLRKPTQSRRVFYDLLLLYRSALPRMDDSSQFYGIGILIKRALQLNTNLLRLLSTDLTSPPSFYGSYHFNHLLKILSTNALPSAQIFATQVLIIEQMQGRGIHLNLAGYKALLKGYAHDPAKFDMVASQMVQAGYNLSKDDSLNLDGAGYGPVGAHVKSLDELSLSLRDAKNFSELSSRIAVHRSDLSDVRVWRTVLSNYRRTHEAIDLCLHFVKSEKLTMTTYLAGLLLQACKSEASLVQVGRICQTAVSRSVPFDTFLWVEYLKRIIWSGNPGEAVSIVAVEPGGNHLLDMDPAVRRDPRVWNATVQALNQQVKQGNLTAQKHARYLGMMVKGLREFEVVYNQSLMWCILEAAIYSGSRMWAKRHSCDTIVAIFEHEVDMIGNEPWKIPGNDLLWHAYMKVLVANEETTRLSDAMRRLLGTGLSPSRRLMRTFALGLWESGNIQLLEYWRKYFEEETDLAWPESDDVFATRRALRLRYFYD